MITATRLQGLETSFHPLWPSEHLPSSQNFAHLTLGPFSKIFPSVTDYVTYMLLTVTLGKWLKFYLIIFAIFVYAHNLMKSKRYWIK